MPLRKTVNRVKIKGEASDYLELLECHSCVLGATFQPIAGISYEKRKVR